MNQQLSKFDVLERMMEGDNPNFSGEVLRGDAFPLKHTFADGCYVREIFIPAGHVVIGKIHKHSHPNFLMQGKVTVFTADEGTRHLQAPMSMISPAGTKRIVYTHTDTRWTTVHVTNKTDLDDIEEEVIAKTYLEAEEEAKCLGQ